MRRLSLLFLSVPLLFLSACKHPLSIQGQGDIIETEQGLRGCSLEEFELEFPRCTNNAVSGDATVIYQALPRAGWRFSRWQGGCAQDATSDSCEFNYSETAATFWDNNFPDTTVPALTAVFIRDNDANPGRSYLAAALGSVGSNRYASLLDALFSDDGSYRYTTAQGTTLDDFDRTPAFYARQGNGLLATGKTKESYVPGGAATATMDFLTLVDTDTSDNEISVTHLVPEQKNASASAFRGTYYCGHISTLQQGFASFFRAEMAGNGRGAMTLISDRYGRSGSALVKYQVLPDGTTIFEYAGSKVSGGLSADGSVFAGSQINNNARGSALCIRASSYQTLGTVRGEYYGAWMSTQPVTAVTDLLVTASGQTAESVVRDSTGGRSYSLGSDFMLVYFDGQLATSSNYGAISADGRIMFIITTNPNKYPTLVAYIRKTG